MKVWNRNAYTALALTLALYLTLAYIYALIKPMWCDEIWTALPTLDLWEWYPTGHIVRWFPPLSYHTMVGWWELWGYSLMSMRSHTMLWGVVLLVGIYSVGKQYGTWIGVWAALLCATDYNFLFCSDSRPDIMCAALGIWGVALRNQWLASAAMLVHPFGVLYVVLVAVLRRRLDWLPVATAVGLWVLSTAVVPVNQPLDEMRRLMSIQIRQHQGYGQAIRDGYGTGWRLLLLAIYVGASAKSILKHRWLAWPFGLIVMGALFGNDGVPYFPHAIPWFALAVAMQMRRYPWLAGVLVLELAFAVTTLFPLWEWDGLKNLG